MVVSLFTCFISGGFAGDPQEDLEKVVSETLGPGAMITFEDLRSMFAGTCVAGLNDMISGLVFVGHPMSAVFRVTGSGPLGSLFPTDSYHYNPHISTTTVDHPLLTYDSYSVVANVFPGTN